MKALAIILLATATAHANPADVIGLGARAIAMGGAQVASVEDSTAGYYNPARLARMAEAAHKLARPDAAERLADLVERTARKTYRTRDDARADVFDYIERFYNPKRRHSTIGYMGPMDFETKAGLA